jgi:hypothetical protein
MITVFFYALTLLRFGEAHRVYPAERARSAHDTTGCSPAWGALPVVPDSIISPDGRWRVLLDVGNGGVDSLTIYDRVTGRRLFSGKYEVTSFLWTTDNRLLLGIGPIYDRPRILMISGNPARSRVLVRPSNRNKVYPDGADLFVVCSVGTNRGKTVLRDLTLPHIEKIDYRNVPKFTHQHPIQIPG